MSPRDFLRAAMEVCLLHCPILMHLVLMKSCCRPTLLLPLLFIIVRSRYLTCRIIPHAGAAYGGRILVALPHHGITCVSAEEVTLVVQPPQVNAVDNK